LRFIGAEAQARRGRDRNVAQAALKRRCAIGDRNQTRHRQRNVSVKFACRRYHLMITL